MERVIGIELIQSEFHDIIEPFLSLTTSYKERIETFYVFTSLDEVNDLVVELSEFEIIESIHKLYFLENPTLFHDFTDYGFHTSSGYYLLEGMTTYFTIDQRDEGDQEMALLQFDEHLLAIDEGIYYVDQHHQELIQNIANAYNISIHFFELDK
ncbi:hypothetical protein ACOI1C_02430 [Bacillus sp. DJP31]|uniref:hypothetical protein n=1 Tax=Bacillus sp. DJP31 TaxID=3409789 RepID=UPI003BB589B5